MSAPGLRVHGAREAKWRVALQHLLAVAGALALWQLLVASGVASPVFLPGPGAVARTWWDLVSGAAPGMAPLPADVLASLRRQLLGFGIATLLGVPVGFALGAFPERFRGILACLKFLFPIPTLAWVPLALLWFGPGDFAILFITFLSAFWPVCFSTLDGVRNLNRGHVRVSRALGARPWAFFIRVAVPGSLPHVMTGLRLSYGASWRMLVAAEILLATSGLGHVIDHSRSMLRTDQVIAGMVTIGVLGYLVERYLFTTLEGLTIDRWGMRHAGAA